MKNESRGIVFCLFTLIVFLSSPLTAQSDQYQQKQKVPRDSLLKVARIIIDSSKCSVLVTVDKNGKPHAREMAPFKIEDDWVIWLGTSTNSRKVKQIKNNPNIVVFYYNDKDFSYVSISGKAILINDSDKKAKYWHEYWMNYYPDRDKDYILIKLIPESMEVCSYKYKFFWDPKTKAPPSIVFEK